MQSGEEETVQYTMRMIKERSKANERARENDVEGAEKSRSSWFVLALATKYVPWHNGGSATAAAPLCHATRSTTSFIQKKIIPFTYYKYRYS